MTVNVAGRGRAFYMASRNDERIIADFYGRLIEELDVKRALNSDLPDGVTAQRRLSDADEFVFVMNFTRETQTIALNGQTFINALDESEVAKSLKLQGCESAVLRRPLSRGVTCDAEQA